jgi:hypothetical protein
LGVTVNDWILALFGGAGRGEGVEIGQDLPAVDDTFSCRWPGPV